MTNTIQNNYSCVVCRGAATKPPCVRKVDPDRPLTPSQSTLGTWKCAKCGTGVKVTRQRAAAKKEAA